MDIADAVTTEFVEFEPWTPVSKLRGAFDTNESARVVVIADGGSFEGVVTQKQLLSSHHDPDEKASSVMRSAPNVERTEDVRETARLLVESELKLLPVVEDGTLRGVVTARDLLGMVRENFEVLAVEDVYTRDLVSVEPDATLGEVINLLREQGITRLPVVDGGDAVGVVSVYDLVNFTVREMSREQGGSAGGFDTGGDARSTGRTHGGFGERAGEAARMLDLPASDVMSTPVETTTPEERLDDALAHMLEYNHSSLVVVDSEADTPIGIVTTTDALQALTVTDEDRMTVQIFGVTHLDDTNREAITERIEAIDGKYERMDVLEANVVFHRHKEKVRGTPLLLSTIRLFTDEGRFSGSGEGYGARAAFDAAADVLERNVLDDKERKKPERKPENKRERAEHLVSWWLEG